MTALSTVLVPGILRSIDSATFTGSYQAVGTAITHPGRIIKFTNASNVAVTISWDGTTDNDYLPANAFLLLDICTNHGTSLILEIKKGTQFFVKGSAGTGSFYISYYHSS